MGSRFADIPVLNHLIAVLIDARRLYERAAQIAHAPAAIAAIQRTRQERAIMLSDLQARVRSLGGRAQSEGSMLGAAHKAFLNVRAVFDHDLDAALAEVERGEHFLRDEIRKAMRRDDVSADTRAFLGVCLDDVVTGEHRIEDEQEHAAAEQRPH